MLWHMPKNAIYFIWYINRVLLYLQIVEHSMPLKPRFLIGSMKYDLFLVLVLQRYASLIDVVVH